MQNLLANFAINSNEP